MYEGLVNDLLNAAEVDNGTSTSGLLKRAAKAIERLEERVAIMSDEHDMQWVDAKKRLPDKGKVIKAFELEVKYTNWDCRDECPYYGKTDCDCYIQVIKDALELLKEQKPIKDGDA